MANRTRLLLGLDIGMFLLVVVLECLALTGLDLHEWLGFVLCPLVLVHVVLQWEWFVTQFQRIRTNGAYRVRINASLNLALLIMMAAVLISGVLASRQATSLIGESFGRVGVWRMIHGWLNFVVVVLVGLHLALNWDWMIGALRRRRPERPALAGAAPPKTTAVSGRRFPGFANSFRRGLAVLVVTSFCAAFAYLAMWTMMSPGEKARIENQRAPAVRPIKPPQTAQTPQPSRPPRPRRARPVELPHGVEQLIVTSTVLAVTVLIGRYVFRLRL